MYCRRATDPWPTDSDIWRRNINMERLRVMVGFPTNFRVWATRDMLQIANFRNKSLIRFFFALSHLLSLTVCIDDSSLSHLQTSANMHGGLIASLSLNVLQD